MVLVAYLNPQRDLLKSVRVPLLNIYIPQGGSGMPTSSEKIPKFN